MAVEKFITIASLEPVELGDELKVLGPHVTLCPPFSADAEQLGRYHARLEALMDENPRGLIVQGAHSVMVGPNNDQSALRLNLGMFGFSFHAAAYVGGQEIGDPDPTFSGLKWNPHVTLPNADYVLPKTPFSIPEIQLFKKTPEKLWRCIAHYAHMACHYLDEERT